MKRVVISQPMYFPWQGMFQQMKLADVFIHYDDAAYTHNTSRSFLSRVQLKTANGSVWLTVPVRAGNGTPLCEAPLMENGWQKKHLRSLGQSLSRQTFAEEAVALAQQVLQTPHGTLADLNMHAMEIAADYLGIAPQVMRSTAMQAQGRSSERVLRLVQEVGGTHYLTGHGAAQYLDHEIFENAGITIEYMDYSKRPYPQKYGDFTPYVTILDLIASQGKAAYDLLTPQTVPWRQFLQEHNA